MFCKGSFVFAWTKLGVSRLNGLCFGAMFVMFFSNDAGSKRLQTLMVPSFFPQSQRAEKHAIFLLPNMQSCSLENVMVFHMCVFMTQILCENDPVRFKLSVSQLHWMLDTRTAQNSARLKSNTFSVVLKKIIKVFTLMLGFNRSVNQRLQGQQAHSTSFCFVCFFLPVAFKNLALLEQRYRGLCAYVKCYCFPTENTCVHCGKDFSALGRLVFSVLSAHLTSRLFESHLCAIGLWFSASKPSLRMSKLKHCLWGCFFSPSKWVMRCATLIAWVSTGGLRYCDKTIWWTKWNHVAI